MATSYPTSKQSFTNPSAGDPTTAPSHAGLHADLADTVEAIQDVIGTGAGLTLSAAYAPAKTSPPVPGGVSQDWLVPIHTSKGTSGAISNDSARYLPIWIPKQVSVDRIGLELVTAQAGAASCQIGLYTSDANGRPASLVSGSDGTIDGSGATGLLTVTVSLTLAPGLYYGCFLSKITGTSPTWRTYGGGISVPFNITNIVSGTVIYQAYTGVIAGATLPSTANVNSVTNAASSPLVGLRVA